MPGKCSKNFESQHAVCLRWPRCVFVIRMGWIRERLRSSMAERRILFDLTDFLSVPLRTGIQRVCYEIVRSWPNTSQLVPAWIDPRGRLFVLPPSVLDLVVEFFQTPVEALHPIRLKIRRSTGLGTPVRTPAFASYAGLLLASLFWEGGRVEFYLNAAKNGLAERIFALVYDMLPWLHPELFIPGFGSGMMNYIWGLRGLPNGDLYLRTNARPGHSSCPFRQPPQGQCFHSVLRVLVARSLHSTPHAAGSPSSVLWSLAKTIGS